MRIRKLSLIVILGISLGCATSSYNSSAQISEQDAAQRRQNYVANNPDLPPTAKEQILGGRLYIGMSKDTVLASWGGPSNVTRSGNATSIGEVWVYCQKVQPFSDLDVIGMSPADVLAMYRMALTNRRCAYLFFDNGIFTRYEEK